MAQQDTIEAWAACAPECLGAESFGAWEVGITTASEADRQHVRAAVASLDPDLPVVRAIARLSTAELPACTVLLADRDYVAALAWGQPLTLHEFAPWEYVLESAERHGDAELLAPGTVVVVESCGPTIFPTPFKERV